MGESPTLTQEKKKSKKAHKPALTRSVRSLDLRRSEPLSDTFLRANDPQSAILKSRARVALLWDRLLRDLKGDR